MRSTESRFSATPRTGREKGVAGLDKEDLGNLPPPKLIRFNSIGSRAMSTGRKLSSRGKSSGGGNIPNMDDGVLLRKLKRELKR